MYTSFDFRRFPRAIFISIGLVILLLAACGGSPQVGAPATTDTVVAGTAATPEQSPNATAKATVAPSPIAEAPATAAPSPSATEPMPTTAPIATATLFPSETPGVFAAFDLSAYTVHPGDLIALHGQGFAPGETVHIGFSGNPDSPLGEVQANQRGEVAASDLRLPQLAEGQHTLVAAGTASGREASRVVSFIDFHPYVTLSSYAVHVGEAFGFNGSAFVPGEQVQVFLDGGITPMATVNADNRGNIYTELLVRATAQAVGKHNLEFVAGNGSVHLPVAYEVLPFVPLMELTTYAGPPGSVVGFTGHGFAAGETVRVYLQQDDGRQEIASFMADDEGRFQNAGQFTAPADATQNLTIVLEGDQSHVPVSQRFGLLPLAPWAGLSAYSGPPGTQIDLYAKGFGAGEVISVTLGSGPDAEQVLTANTDSRGELQGGPYSIPSDAQGTLSFTFQGENSGGTASAEFRVTGQ